MLNIKKYHKDKDHWQNMGEYRATAYSIYNLV